ncbi:HAMP domain-containing sensor histidine kinase [Prochlorococcus sp. MIT 1223]|uniref:sensor histidine kinase n=1 Tax=Prochlorococcus sp. MIT 1223 TaxID=3096217 RepID=UPI002A751911|nr:HAMP domain-containing sensor histidine kinase [Prochlorococcus sp. MIT 1223]
MNSFETEAAVDQLIVYVAKSSDGNSPSLEVAGQWPESKKVLKPLESDRELRTPSPSRRWYPLQEESILLGVLRVEISDNSEEWPGYLDRRLQSSAMALAQCLGLEFEKERLLNELNQQREQIGMMVHQLRNPLAALRTYAKLLLRKLGPESDYRSLLEGLLNEQEQLNNYVSVLDDLSQVKLPAGKVAPAHLLLPPVFAAKGSVNLKNLLEPLIDRASVTANLQGRDWYGPSQWPKWMIQPISKDEGVIAEIVANLLENAFKYSPDSSPIGIHLNQNAICVWDGGIPIKEDLREKIFNKGFRANDSSEISGSGLGLAFAKELTEQLEGELKLINRPFDFDSNLPLEGNAFVITFPTKLQIEKEV